MNEINISELDNYQLLRLLRIKMYGLSREQDLSFDQLQEEINEIEHELLVRLEGNNDSL